jgi:hypothetical protein
LEECRRAETLDEGQTKISDPENEATKRTKSNENGREPRGIRRFIREALAGPGRPAGGLTIHHIIWKPIPAERLPPRASRLASRVSRERALTQPRRSHTEENRHGVHREGRGTVYPRGRAARGGRRRDGRVRATGRSTVARTRTSLTPSRGPAERPAPADTRVAAASSVVVAATCRAHAQLDHPSRGSAPVDPCSPGNPWLKLGLATVLVTNHQRRRPAAAACKAPFVNFVDFVASFLRSGGSVCSVRRSYRAYLLSVNVSSMLTWTAKGLPPFPDLHSDA